jgi:hypothetical protein
MKILINKERTLLKEAHPGIIIALKGRQFRVVSFEELPFEENLCLKQA